MGENERNINEIDEYQGLGTAPKNWLQRIQTLRMHKKNFGSGQYKVDTFEKLYLDSIESIKRFIDNGGIDTKNVDANILQYYPGWEKNHFEQLLLQLGEL